MKTGWFGVPWYAYGLICLLVAVSYAIFAIDPVKGYNWLGQSSWRFIVLRWFHTLAWVLLGSACLIMQLKAQAGTGWAKSLGLTALLVYLVYIVVLYLQKGKPTM